MTAPVVSREGLINVTYSVNKSKKRPEITIGLSVFRSPLALRLSPGFLNDFSEALVESGKKITVPKELNNLDWLYSKHTTCETSLECGTMLSFQTFKMSEEALEAGLTFKDMVQAAKKITMYSIDQWNSRIQKALKLNNKQAKILGCPWITSISTEQSRGFND